MATTAVAVSPVDSPTDIEPTDITRTCRLCGKTKPITEFRADSRCRNGRGWQCRICMNAYKRDSERAKNDPESFPAVARAVDNAPDRRPPMRLRIELERRRAAGCPWRIAWPIAVRMAVRGLSPAEAAEWRRVFASTRGAWQGSYCGIAWPIATGPTLFVPDERAAA